MRFAVVGPAHPLRGGIAHHVYLVRKALADRGHEVRVISYQSLYPWFLFPGRTVFDTSNVALIADSEPILKPLSPATWLRASRLVSDWRPDLVLFQWWNPFFAPAIGTLLCMCRLAGLKSAVECHNVTGHEPTFLDLPLTGLALREAEHFVVHSEADRLDLLDLLPGRDVKLASLGAAAEFVGAPAPRSGRTILFFGLVREYKGLDVLLRAFGKVPINLDCRLVVTGEFYDDEKKYLDLISDLGIETRVTLTNRYIPNEEVPRLFEKVDVLVLPYLTATQSAVAQIAFANLLPVIASEVGGLAEVVVPGVNGLLVQPGDEAALAETITKYFNEGLGPTLMERMKARDEAGQRQSIAAILEGFLQES